MGNNGNTLLKEGRNHFEKNKQLFSLFFSFDSNVLRGMAGNPVSSCGDED
jgi:hypothetical protein